MNFAAKVTATALSLMLAIVCAYAFVFAKIGRQQRELRDEIAVKQVALASLAAKTQSVDVLLHRIEFLENSLDTFDKKRSRIGQADQVVAEISPLAEANSLTMKSTRTLPPLRCNGYAIQPIEMKLNGDFNGLYSFVQQIEKMPRIVQIPSMNLSKDRGGEATAQLTLNIFCEPDDATAAAR